MIMLQTKYRHENASLGLGRYMAESAKNFGIGLIFQNPLNPLHVYRNRYKHIDVIILKCPYHYTDKCLN